MATHGRLATSYLLTCAVIGVAGALLLTPVNWLSTIVFATVPFASAALTGLWMLPAAVALRLLQRPGAGILVGLISGIVLVPFSGYGVSSVVTGLFWALFAELGFLVVLYRLWTIWQHLTGAALVSIAWPLGSWQFMNLGAFGLPLQIAFFALCLASTVAAAFAGAAIGDGLRRAGVARTAARRRARSASGGR
jgi:energy-coupling factor transport system permease protein